MFCMIHSLLDYGVFTYLHQKGLSIRLILDKIKTKVIDMGGKGSGRKRRYSDKYHSNQRKYQLKYDSTIADIRQKHNCTFLQAQIILRKRRLKEKEK